MAKKVEYLLVDDTDGSKADETLTFGLDGATYEIDLSGANASALRESLSGYVGHARRIGGRIRASRGRAASAAAVSTKDVRAWARENGLEVSERGRVSAEVLSAYNAAH